MANQNKKGDSSAALGQSLLRAAENGNELSLLQLLQKGADPNVRDAHSDTALHICLMLKEKREACVRILVQYGANTSLHNSNNLSPIHLAMSHGWSKDVIKMLILHTRSLDFDRPQTVPIVCNPLEHAVFDPRSNKVWKRDQELAMMLLQFGCYSPQELKLCLWYELHRGEEGGALLNMLMDSFARLPSLLKLQDSARLGLGMGMIHALVGINNIENDGMMVRDLLDIGNARARHRRHRNPTPSLHSVSGTPMGIRAYDELVKVKKAAYSQRLKVAPSLQHECRCAMRRACLAGGLKQVISQPVPLKIREYTLLGYEIELKNE